MRNCIRLTIGVLLLGMLVSNGLKAGDPAGENRRAVTRELLNLAAVAQRHFYTPISQGGGGGAFDNSTGGVGITNILNLTRRPATPAGSYTLGTVACTSIILNGVGFARGTDGNPVMVTCTVFADSVTLIYDN